MRRRWDSQSGRWVKGYVGVGNKVEQEGLSVEQDLENTVANKDELL